MKLKRVITVYSNETESVLYEIDVSHIKLKTLKKMVIQHDGDDEFYYCYRIDNNIAIKLSKYINEEFDFENKIYSLECYQDT